MKALNSGISPGEAFLRTVGGGIIGHELSTVNLSTIVNFSITSIKHLVDANYINRRNWPVFKTLDAAAYGFSKYLIGGGAFSNGVPKDYQNREFSSILYSFTGKEPSGTVKTFYSFTRPETSNGSVHKSPGPKDLKALVPNGGTPEAHIHNHLPDFSGSYASMENRRFSKNSILEKRDEYMVATNPDLQFYLLNSWGEIYIQREISQFSQIEDLFIAEGFYTGKLESLERKSIFKVIQKKCILIIMLPDSITSKLDSMLKQFVITSVILQLSCLIMFSCKENEQNDFTLKIPKHDTGSIVLRDIPGSIVSSPVEVQKEWFEQVTGLTSLKNGYSGIQLRIYQDYNDYTGRVVMLRDSNDVWEAKLINYKTVYGKAGEMKAVSFQKINLNTPKSGWKKFADKLNDLKLKSIEKQEVMTETYDTEKVITTLEIANQNNYLFNKYTETNVGDNKQDVNKVQRLLYLIKDEFNI